MYTLQQARTRTQAHIHKHAHIRTHTHTHTCIHAGKYIPFCTRERFLANKAALSEPELERFDGVVAFADISGFTKISEALANKHGTRIGAEVLNRCISGQWNSCKVMCSGMLTLLALGRSGYFEKLIQVIFQFEGDILKVRPFRVRLGNQPSIGPLL